MNYFNLIVIFFIFDVISIWSADGFPKKLNNVQLSSGINSNPFLQPIMRVPNVENQNQNQNPFLPPIKNNNKNGNPFLSNNFSSLSSNSFSSNTFSSNPLNPFLSNSFSSQPSNTVTSNNNYYPFASSINNPFLNPITTGTRLDTDSTHISKPKPVVSRPINISKPIDNTNDIPIINTNPRPIVNISASINNISITSPPKPRPSVSRFPSLEDLIPIKTGPVKTISEIKIVGKTMVSTLTGISSDVLQVNNICENANRLVVNGIEANAGEFPHMVALGRRSSQFILMCGGTLISHSWILSAAHCTHGSEGAPTHARLGFLTLTDQDGILIAIKNMTRHPDYNPPALYADIALMKLENDITFSTTIRPACVYQQYDKVPRKAWISGWGITKFAGEISDKLLKAELELMDNLVCTIKHNSSLEIPYGITPSMICAGDPYGNWTKDACNGDSGGPLQIIHPKNKCVFQVIGITSFGQGCAMIDIPGVYTRVSHYLPWIENIVWPQGQ